MDEQIGIFGVTEMKTLKIKLNLRHCQMQASFFDQDGGTRESLHAESSPTWSRSSQFLGWRFHQ